MPATTARLTSTAAMVRPRRRFGYGSGGRVPGYDVAGYDVPGYDVPGYDVPG